jgi:hypothetical protein
LVDSGACPTPYDSSIYGTNWMSAEGCSAVVNAWSGGVLRTGTNQLVLWGGGHSDYGGNEIYTVNFTNNLATFQRIFGPTLPGVGACPSTDHIASLPATGCVAGGVAPNSRHTYNGLAYIPAHSDASGTNHEEMLIIGGSVASGGGSGDNEIWVYDFSAGTWTLLATNPMSTTDNLSNAIAWDPTDKVVYMMVNNLVGVFNPSSTTATTASGSLAGHAWRTIGSTAGYLCQSMAIDQASHTMVFMHGGGGNGCAGSGSFLVDVISLANGTSTRYSNPSGCPAQNLSDTVGMAFDTSLNKLVFHNSDQDASIYIWDTVAHTCTQETYGGSPPTGVVTGGAGVHGGNLGRFRYVPGKDYYVYVGDAKHAPFILCRQPGGCGP